MEGLLGRLMQKLSETFGGPHTEHPDSLQAAPDSLQVTPSPFEPDTLKNIDRLIAPQKQVDGKKDALLKAIMRFGPSGSMKDWS